MRGDFGEGWDEYEWRLRSSERKGPRFPEKPWQGESLAGKHIYVQAEQGFGDTLQFARYIPLLAARAGKVTLRVHQQLVTLLRESLPGITVLGDRGDPAPYHCDAVLLSLPRLFKTRLETIPAEVPYLRAPAEAAQRWQQAARARWRASRSAWCGPAIPNTSTITAARSIWRMLAPLFAVPGASFASLQFGPRAADLKKLTSTARPPIDDLAPELQRFRRDRGGGRARSIW